MARISEQEAGGKNVLAFLDMIAWAEGTDKPGQRTKDDGYDVLVGGELFTSYVDHPREFVYIPRYRVRSSAAGRYQLLSRYWDIYSRRMDLKGGFTPENQDRVAVRQIKEQRALPDIQAGRFTEAVRKVSNIWASLPGAGYGQREQKLSTLRKIYEQAGGYVEA